MERGVTLSILIMCAMCFLTLSPDQDFLVRRLFSMTFVPLPSPPISFAEDGDVKTAL
jgi:hypothetical protein